MTDWQTRVRRHLRNAALELPDAVVEELADHLEDAWERATGRRRRRPSRRRLRRRATLRRADFLALARRRGAAPRRRCPSRAAAPAAAASAASCGTPLRLLRRGARLHRRRRGRARPRHRRHDRRVQPGVLGAAGAAPLRRRRPPGDGVGAQPHPRPARATSSTPATTSPGRSAARRSKRRRLQPHRGQPVGRRRRPRGAARRGRAAARARHGRRPAGGRPSVRRRRRRCRPLRAPCSSPRGCGSAASAAPPMPSAARWCSTASPRRSSACCRPIFTLAGYRGEFWRPAVAHAGGAHELPRPQPDVDCQAARPACRRRPRSRSWRRSSTGSCASIPTSTPAGRSTSCRCASS